MRWGGRWRGGGEVALRRVRGRRSLRGVFHAYVGGVLAVREGGVLPVRCRDAVG